MVELLAPAGSREALAAAVESGADAVYLAGTMFGARAHADNFDEESLREAIRFAHQRNVHVHVTVNTIVDDGELPRLKKYLRFLYEAGADAVLVQDLGVARLVRETVPKLPMHASTQMTVHNLDGVQALEAMGFSRVVLSRELSLAAIRHICSHAKAQIEVFVHGALCVCYSGQCLMSSIIGGRSGNRGCCAQPCRLPYTLVDEADNDLLAGSGGQYLLSPRDLNAMELLPRLLEAGVSSLKIEGRMKRPEYVAVAVGCYRRAVDSCLAGDFAITPEDAKALAQIFNRDFTTAYLEKKQGRNMMSDKRPNNRGLMLGRVLSYDGTSGLVSMKLSMDLSLGDQVDFWVKVGGRVTATIRKLYILKEPKGTAGKNKRKNQQGISLQNLIPVEKAEPGTTVAFAIEKKAFPGDRAFKVYDAALMNKARAVYSTGAPVRRYGLKVWARAAVGEPLHIRMEDEAGHVAEAATGFVGQAARKRPLNRETIEKQIGRLGSSIFQIDSLAVDISGEVMVPISEINEARRCCIESLEAQRLAEFENRAKKFSAMAADSICRGMKNIRARVDERRKIIAASARSSKYSKLGTVITTIVDSQDKVQAALEAGAGRIVFGGESYSHKKITLDMYHRAAELSHNMGAAIIFNTPRIIRDGEIEHFHKWLQNVAGFEPDGISVHNIGSLHAVRELTEVPIEADYSLISYNLETLMHLKELGADRAVLSPELNMAQVEKLARESPLPLECLVDAHLELMVSEYCCTGSFLGGLDTGKCSAPCINMGKKFYLKDRKDIRFPLVMDQYCHMHLLNANRLSMLPHVTKLKTMGLKAVRIDGRYLSAEELSATIRNYVRYMKYEGGFSLEQRAAIEALEGKNITRGHYFRGV